MAGSLGLIWSRTFQNCKTVAWEVKYCPFSNACPLNLQVLEKGEELHKKELKEPLDHSATKIFCSMWIEREALCPFGGEFEDAKGKQRREEFASNLSADFRAISAVKLEEGGGRCQTLL